MAFLSRVACQCLARCYRRRTAQRSAGPIGRPSGWGSPGILRPAKPIALTQPQNIPWVAPLPGLPPMVGGASKSACHAALLQLALATRRNYHTVRSCARESPEGDRLCEGNLRLPSSSLGDQAPQFDLSHRSASGDEAARPARRLPV
jgi:hypothetical protein